MIDYGERRKLRRRLGSRSSRRSMTKTKKAPGGARAVRPRVRLAALIREVYGGDN
jgi:hypothetical protein